MKKISILFLLITFTQANYSMEKTEPEIVNTSLTTEFNTESNIEEIQNIQSIQEKIIDQLTKLNISDHGIGMIKKALKKSFDRGIIDNDKILKELVSFVRRETTFTKLIINLKDCLNLNELTKLISEMTGVPESATLKIIKYVINKYNAKKNPQELRINHLTNTILRRIRNMTIGGASAICIWALGHGIFHDIMEYIEPTTLLLAAPEVLLAIITTYLIYKSKGTLKILKANLIEKASKLAVNNLLDNDKLFDTYATPYLNCIEYFKEYVMKHLENMQSLNIDDELLQYNLSQEDLPPVFTGSNIDNVDLDFYTSSESDAE